MRRCPNCDAINSDEARFCQSCGSGMPREAAPAEVRKVVSVVFCDLTGSTALGESLDPETLRRIITRYFGEMKNILSKHGGTVEKFIGDAVMAAFGIPVIHEQDALRAVRAAHEMQRAMRIMNEDLELEYGKTLLARIGVNTGEVIAGDPQGGHGFASGDTINVAARLEQAAAPGTVLIGETTYDLVRDSVTVEPVEPLTLKGKSEPVPAYRVLDVAQVGAGRVRRFESVLIGRAKEMERLTGVLQQAMADGQAKLATVFGSAGTGKSRLTQEFVSSLEGKAQVVQGSCLPYGDGITFWPISQIVKHICDISEDDDTAAALAKIAARLPSDEEGALVTSRIAAAVGLSDETPSAQETFWAVRRFFEHLSADSPFVVVFEDIHWAEPTMLDLIEYLVSFSQERPMMLLCLARRDLLDVRPTWGRATASTTILLEPLTQDDVNHLIGALLGVARLPEAVRAQIQRAAEGNPLYVEEIINMMIDKGFLQQDGEHWRPTAALANLTIPPTIQALIAARLDQLDGEERAVVQRGSVVGKEFWWSAITELIEEDFRPSIGHRLQSLVRKELIRPTQSTFSGEDAYEFSHILVRDSAYGGIQKEIRADFHQRFAEWLEAKTGERAREYEEILGYHLEQSFLLREELGQIDDETKAMGARAAGLLTSAGRRALAKADAPAAAGLLQRGTKLMSIKDPVRLELSLDLATAYRELGSFKEALDVVDQAKRAASVIGDDRLAGRADLDRCVLDGYTGAEDWSARATSEAERLLTLFTAVGDSLGQARSHQLLADVHWDEHQNEATVESLGRALESLDQPENEAEAHKVLAWMSEAAFWGPTPVLEALSICERVHSVSGTNQIALAGALRSQAGLEAMRGNFDEARSLAARGRAIGQELGLRLQLAGHSQYAGLVELLAGDATAAEEHLKRGLDDYVSMGERAYLGTQAALLARVLYQQERYDEAEAMTRLSEEAGEDDESLKAEWGPTRARVLGRRGDLIGAKSLAVEAAEIALGGDTVITRGYALMGLAELFLFEGDTTGALEWIRKTHELYVAKGIVPWAQRTAGLLEQLEAG